MTYALAWPLQEALFALITSDPSCNSFFGSRVYDFAQPFGDEAEAEGRTSDQLVARVLETVPVP